MLLRPGLPPAGAQDQWALELKWDGMRAQFRVARDGGWCLRSRPGRNCSDQFPELLRSPPPSHGARGTARRRARLPGRRRPPGLPPPPPTPLGIQRTRAASLLAAQHPATLVVFDVLHLDGRAVRALPYHRRRELLERTLPDSGRYWRIPAPLTGGARCGARCQRAHQLEGIVAKRLDAPYEPGRRSGAWLKHKHRRQETFAVTGWRPAPHYARRPDAIFVARAAPDGHLHPAGTAELGLCGQQRDLLGRAQTTTPRDPPRRPPRRGRYLGRRGLPRRQTDRSGTP